MDISKDDDKTNSSIVSRIKSTAKDALHLFLFVHWIFHCNIKYWNNPILDIWDLDEWKLWLNVMFIKKILKCGQCMQTAKNQSFTVIWRECTNFWYALFVDCGAYLDWQEVILLSPTITSITSITTQTKHFQSISSLLLTDRNYLTMTPNSLCFNSFVLHQQINHIQLPP